jgi:hypothetical protein
VASHSFLAIGRWFLALGKSGAKFVKFVKFTASDSSAAAVAGFAATDVSLNLSGGDFAQGLPQGGVRRQKSPVFIADVTG